MIEPRMMLNTALRPGNSYLARAYPAIVERSEAPSELMTA